MSDADESNQGDDTAEGASSNTSKNKSNIRKVIDSERERLERVVEVRKAVGKERVKIYIQASILCLICIILNAVLLVLRWKQPLPVVGDDKIVLRPVTTDEAVEHCLELIRQCIMEDGSIRLKADPKNVTIQPYAANLAGLALLAGEKSGDRVSVEKWLEWYALNQNDDGSMEQYEGKKGQKILKLPRGKQETPDETFPTSHLMLVGKHYNLTKQTTPSIRASSKKSLEYLLKNSVNTKNRYVISQIHIYGGLVAGGEYFKKIGDEEAATKAAEALKKMSEDLPKYWQADRRIFAFLLNEKGEYITEDYTQSMLACTFLPNLLALTWVSAEDKNPWRFIRTSQLKPDGGDAPQAPVEWWYMAALHAGNDKEIEEYKNLMLKEAYAFEYYNIYVQRPAIQVLALKEGSSWLKCLNK